MLFRSQTDYYVFKVGMSFSYTRFGFMYVHLISQPTLETIWVMLCKVGRGLCARTGQEHQDWVGFSSGMHDEPGLGFAVTD